MMSSGLTGEPIQPKCEMTIAEMHLAGQQDHEEGIRAGTCGAIQPMAKTRHAPIAPAVSMIGIHLAQVR